MQADYRRTGNGAKTTQIDQNMQRLYNKNRARHGLGLKLMTLSDMR